MQMAVSLWDTYNLNAVMLQEMLGALLGLLEPETTAFFTLILTEEKPAQTSLSVDIELWVCGCIALKE